MTPSYHLNGKRVFVAGHRGMVGAALVRQLMKEDCELLGATRTELDLRDQNAVMRWFSDHRPEAVFMAAAKVGGIRANSLRPAEFISENLMLELNVIDAAYRAGVEKMVFLGSSCVYPKFAPQPISEDALLTGPLEPTNEWYAIAKIAGIKLCQAYKKQYGRHFISAMPTNLYGPGDNFDLESSHVVPALIRKAYEAKISGADRISVWGSGTPRREFLHVDDCAGALVHLMKHYDGYDHINVGFGEDISISDLAKLICRIVGISDDLHYDSSRPDGTPRKLMSSAKLLQLNWKPEIPLKNGLERTYEWFLDHAANEDLN